MCSAQDSEIPTQTSPASTVLEIECSDGELVVVGHDVIYELSPTLQKKLGKLH